MSAAKCERCGMELKYHGETCTVGGQVAEHSFAAPTGSATRLWVATVHYTLLVVADDIHKARAEAEYHAGEDGSEPDEVDAFAVTEIEEIPLEWRESIPFGGDRKDDRTCVQRVSPNDQAHLQTPGE